MQAEREERDIWLENAIARWEVPLLRTCYLLLNDAALAEDAVQDSFVKAWRAHDRFRGEASEKTWLMRIAVNTCRDLKGASGSCASTGKSARKICPKPALPLMPRTIP